MDVIFAFHFNSLRRSISLQSHDFHSDGSCAMLHLCSCVSPQSAHATCDEPARQTTIAQLPTGSKSSVPGCEQVIAVCKGPGLQCACLQQLLPATQASFGTVRPLLALTGRQKGD